MKKIDILLMTDNSLDTIGGAEESTKIIIKGVKEHYSLGIIHPGTISNYDPGVTCFPLLNKTSLKQLIKRPYSFIKYIWKVKKIIEETNPEAIHTQAQVSFFIVSLLYKFRMISKDIRLIHTERGLFTKYGTFFKGLFYFFMKELDVLITTTTFNKQYWENALNNKKTSVEFEVIENTAGEIFNVYDKNLERTKDDKIVIGFAGRYVDWKNWPLSVDITKSLHKAIGERLVVKMVVGCPDEKTKNKTQEMFNELEELLDNRFQGIINADFTIMNEFYYGIDVFMLTSKHNTESFGRTLVEAMSRKTIVLTSDAGGSVEVVGDKDNVCITADDFVNRILYFYKENLTVQEKEKNLQRVKEHYSLSNNINKHLELYSKIKSN